LGPGGPGAAPDTGVDAARGKGNRRRGRDMGATSLLSHPEVGGRPLDPEEARSYRVAVERLVVRGLLERVERHRLASARHRGLPDRGPGGPPTTAAQWYQARRCRR